MDEEVEVGLLSKVVLPFIGWLGQFGETSFDHQSFYAGSVGGAAKSLYYRSPPLGTLAVAPMIVCEAFFPEARRWFWHKQRFPIADAHYAMGFALLADMTGEARHYDRAVHFVNVLEQTRCPGYDHFCWGYPFDWVTRSGVIAKGTPLITTTPHAYEAFALVHRLDGEAGWRDAMASIAAHAAEDIGDRSPAPSWQRGGRTALGATPSTESARPHGGKPRTFVDW